MRAIRVVGAGIGAAVGTRVLVGGLARVLMRLVSIASGAAGDFSWGGSLSIVLVYAAAMVPGALVAAATTRAARWFVAAAGGVFLCFPAVGVAAEEIGNRSGWSVFRWIAVATASTAVFATIAAAPIVAVRLADRLMGRERPAPFVAASTGEAVPVQASAR